jgi:hypothetical protein
MSVEGWFTTAQTDGRLIWAPAPPAIADVAVKRLCEVRHIRPWCSHLFVCPAIMRVHWRMTLGKVADAMFTIPVGCSIWPSSMHEPLVVALICPLLSCRPWKVRGSPWMVELKDLLRGVWSGNLQALVMIVGSGWALVLAHGMANVISSMRKINSLCYECRIWTMH